MHCKRLADAPSKFFIGGIAVLDQGLGELFGEWIAQHDEVVQSFGSGALHRRLLRRKVICGNMEVQEVTRAWNCALSCFDGALTYTVPAGMMPSNMIWCPWLVSGACSSK